MRTLRRASAVIGIVLVVLFVSIAVARTTRARAEAEYGSLQRSMNMNDITTTAMNRFGVYLLVVALQLR